MKRTAEQDAPQQKPATATRDGGDSAAAVADFYRALLAPGSGEIRRIGELSADRAGGQLFFFGETFADRPGMPAERRLYRLERGAARPLPSEVDAAVLARISPDGIHLALSFRDAQGDALQIVAAATMQQVVRQVFPGHIEELAWSADGQRLLVRVAGLGADQSGRDGGVMPAPAASTPEAPLVLPLDDGDLWRRLWIVDLSGACRCVSAEQETIWDAAWCGREALVVVRSPHHHENAWYRAELALIDLTPAARTRSLYRPKDQIGHPACSHAGDRIAFVEAVCSDRGLVCGALRLLDPATGRVQEMDTRNVDVSSVAFRPDGRVHYAGLRSLETVVGDIHPDGGGCRELWQAWEETCGTWLPASLPIAEERAVIVREGPSRPPEITALATHGPETLFRTVTEPLDLAVAIEMRRLTWKGSGGTSIDGLILLPRNQPGPFPTLLEVHGGPVLAHRARWLANVRTAWLVIQGYAVFQPNPHGSCGRGRAFADAVRQDVGGVDTTDLLSGLEQAAALQLVDPRRLAVTGTSYGGYMAAWLVTQTDVFRASIAISPITDWISQHGTSQIGEFDELFLAGNEMRFARSPVVHAGKVKTPTLLLAGGRDRNTPPGQALEFHTALQENGVTSQCVVYPSAGHSLRDFAILLDVCARTGDWLRAHMP